MATRNQIPGSQWHRWSGYELQGNRIVPAKDATFHSYDPCQDHRQARSRTLVQPPYISLVALWRRIDTELRSTKLSLEETSPKNPPSLSKSTSGDIIAWTAQHGLLGLFHHSTVVIGDPWGKGMWSWAAGKWVRSTPFGAGITGTRTCVTSLVPEPDLSFSVANRHLTRFLHRALRGQFPAPDSREFLRWYGEPLWDWINAVKSLAEAIISRDLETLNMLASRAIRIRWFEGGSVYGGTVFPSLLSIFAEMHCQVLEDGAVVRRCDYCKDAFIANRPWAKYCNELCATKQRQGRFLRKHPTYHKRQSGQQPKDHG